MKRIFLIVEHSYPTVHENLKEARKHFHMIKHNNPAHKDLKAMYCLFKENDLKEGFCNCIFNQFK